MTARKPIVYSAPRMSAQPSSPSEMSAGDIGVVRIDGEGLVVVELEEEVERALGDRAVHRRRGEQRRRDEQRRTGSAGRPARRRRRRAARARTRSTAGRTAARRSPRRARASRACRRAGCARSCAAPAGCRTRTSGVIRRAVAVIASALHQPGFDRADREQRADDGDRREDRDVDRRPGPASRRSCRASASRHRSTPCHSGESQAIGWRNDGRLSIGKNVPLNRNSGVIPNRKSVANWSGVRCVAVKAMIGVAKARPVSTAAGIASTISGERARPEQHDDDREHRPRRASAGTRSRRCCRGRCRAAGSASRTSRGRSCSTAGRRGSGRSPRTSRSA